MNREERLIAMQEMVDKLNKWNEAYYANKQIVDDSVYDTELRKLKELEEELDFVLPNSPTIVVGTTKEESTFEKTKHTVKMLSLDNAFNEEDIEKFMNSLPHHNVVVQPKVDGLSLALWYRDGKLYKAITRGDGEIGEDVTENAKQILNIPKELPLHDDWQSDIKFRNFRNIEVRGEVYISKEDFAKMEGFKNARNAASGSMRLKDVEEVAKRNLRFVAYILTDGRGRNLTHEDIIPRFVGEEQFDEEDIEIHLKYLGFETLPMYKSEGNNPDEHEPEGYSLDTMTMINYIKTGTYPYEIDGAVVKCMYESDKQALGSTSKFPKWAIAFKYPAEATPTTLKKIFATVGRTGKITYNAELEPVEISGSTVSFATLHNADYIRDLDLREGDIVGVKKAGEIIPKVVNSISHKENSVKWEEHTHCPRCGHTLVREGGVDQFCKNDCNLVGKLTHFASRDAVNLNGISEKLIESMVTNLKISKPIDLLKVTKEQLLTLPNVQEKTADNVLSVIEDAKKEMDCYRIVYGIGISLIGKSSAKEIAKSIKKVADEGGRRFGEESHFTGLKDFGEEKVKAAAEWFQNEENFDDFVELFNTFNVEFEEPISVESNGIKVCVTGVFEDASRADVQKLLREKGFEIQKAPSGSTDFLIYGDKAGPSKLEKVSDNKKVHITKMQDLTSWIEKGV